MAYPLTDLIRSLTTRRAVLGRVVSVNGTRIVAATQSGRRLASAATPLATGDRIVITDGLAYLSPEATNSVAV